MKIRIWKQFSCLIVLSWCLSWDFRQADAHPATEVWFRLENPPPWSLPPSHDYCSGDSVSFWLLTECLSSSFNEPVHRDESHPRQLPSRERERQRNREVERDKETEAEVMVSFVFQPRGDISSLLQQCVSHTDQSSWYSVGKDHTSAWITGRRDHWRPS